MNENLQEKMFDLLEELSFSSKELTKKVTSLENVTLENEKKYNERMDAIMHSNKDYIRKKQDQKFEKDSNFCILRLKAALEYQRIPTVVNFKNLFNGNIEVARQKVFNDICSTIMMSLETEVKYIFEYTNQKYIDFEYIENLNWLELAGLYKVFISDVTMSNRSVFALLDKNIIELKNQFNSIIDESDDKTLKLYDELINFNSSYNLENFKVINGNYIIAIENYEFEEYYQSQTKISILLLFNIWCNEIITDIDVAKNNKNWNEFSNFFNIFFNIETKIEIKEEIKTDSFDSEMKKMLETL